MFWIKTPYYTTVQAWDRPITYKGGKREKRRYCKISFLYKGIKSKRGNPLISGKISSLHVVIWRTVWLRHKNQGVYYIYVPYILLYYNIINISQVTLENIHVELNKIITIWNMKIYNISLCLRSRKSMKKHQNTKNKTQQSLQTQINSKV